MCGNSCVSCDSAWPKCSAGVGVFGKVVGLSLRWVVCWYVWDSVWVGATNSHPKVWMLCVHCILIGLMGWSATRSDCGIMSGQ